MEMHLRCLLWLTQFCFLSHQGKAQSPTGVHHAHAAGQPARPAAAATSAQALGGRCFGPCRGWGVCPGLRCPRGGIQATETAIGSDDFGNLGAESVAAGSSCRGVSGLCLLFAACAMLLNQVFLAMIFPLSDGEAPEQNQPDS
eukprot:s2855_g3.t1